MGDLNKRSADVSIHNATTDASVTTTTDGSKERLDVSSSATIINNESPTRYQLKTDYDTTGTSLNTSTDTVLYSYTGDGTLSAIAVTNATTSNYEIAIYIDGTERLRINMSQLGSTLGLTEGSFPIWATNANKQFRFHPTPELGFTTSFEVKAKATVSSTTVYHFIMFKERV